MEKVQAARLPEVSILRRLPEGSRDFYSSIDHKFPCRFLVAHCRREGLFRFDPIAGFYIIENLRGRCHSCHTKDSMRNGAGLDRGDRRPAVEVSQTRRIMETYEPLLNDADAARFLGRLHPKTVQRMTWRGELPGFRIGRYWRFRAGELSDHLRVFNQQPTGNSSGGGRIVALHLFLQLRLLPTADMPPSEALASCRFRRGAHGAGVRLPSVTSPSRYRLRGSSEFLAPLGH
jgi:hypothetical protein